MNYGKAIKIIRSAKDINQKELARLTNLDPSYISLIENNKRKPTLNTLEKISEELAVPIPLITFLSSEENELSHFSGEQMEKIGRELLKILISSHEYNSGINK